jgi:hypothetical protein
MATTCAYLPTARLEAARRLFYLLIFIAAFFIYFMRLQRVHLCLRPDWQGRGAFFYVILYCIAQLWQPQQHPVYWLLCSKVTGTLTFENFVTGKTHTMEGSQAHSEKSAL